MTSFGAFWFVALSTLLFAIQVYEAAIRAAHLAEARSADWQVVLALAASVGSLALFGFGVWILARWPS